MNALNYAAYGVKMPSSDVGGAYIQGQQSRALEQRIGNQNKLAQATVQNAQTAEQESARKEVMQKLGMMAGALYDVKTPEDYQRAEDNLVELGVLTREDAAKYNYGMLPQIVGSVRDYENRIQDDRDRTEFNENVRQFNLKFARDGGKPADEYGRYAAEEAAAGRQPLSRIDYAQAKKGSGITIGPDGTVQIGGGKTPTAITTEAIKGRNAYDSIMKGLDSYEALTAKGGAVIPGEKKDQLDVARRSLQLQMKELFNLGVLNGPDLALMDQLLVDMTSLENNALDAVGIADLENRTKTNVAQLRQMMTDLIEPKLKSAGIDGGSPSAPRGLRKTIGGVTYEQRNGKWGIVQ